MLLSRRCEYGLRAALYLASQSDETPVPVRDVSDRLGIPHAFLAKTVRDLVAAGLVSARSGAGGGLVLTRPAGAIPLREVVLAIDGPALFDACMLRLPGCGELDPCPLHDAWVPIREQIVEMLTTATLATAAEATRARGFRLSAPGLPSA